MTKKRQKRGFKAQKALKTILWGFNLTKKQLRGNVIVELKSRI